MSDQFPKYESPLFFHLFEDKIANKDTNGITICAVPLEIGSTEFKLGYSITHPKDAYSKKKGRMISESRGRSFKSVSVNANNFNDLCKQVNDYADRLLSRSIPR